MDPANDISKVSSSPLFSSIHGDKPPCSSGLTLGFLNQSSTNNCCNLENQETVSFAFVSGARAVTEDESNKTTGPWKNTTRNKDSSQNHSTNKVGRSRSCVHYVTPRKYKKQESSKNNSYYSNSPPLPKKYTPVRAWRPRSKCSLFAHQDMKDFLQAYGGNDGGQHHYPLPMQVLHGELTEHFGNMSISKKKKRGGSSMYYPKNTL